LWQFTEGTIPEAADYTFAADGSVDLPAHSISLFVIEP